MTMKRGLRRHGCLIGSCVAVAVLVAAEIAEAASAASSQAELSCQVDCPGLSSEETASVEARATTDLMARGLLVGTLRLSCQGDVLLAEWEPASPAEKTRVRRSAVASGRTPEALLELLAELLQQTPLVPRPGGDVPDAARIGEPGVAFGQGEPEEVSPEPVTSEADAASPERVTAAAVSPPTSVGHEPVAVSPPLEGSASVGAEPNLEAPVSGADVSWSDEGPVIFDWGVRFDGKFQPRFSGSGGSLGVLGALCLVRNGYWFGVAPEFNIGYGEPGRFALHSEGGAVEFGLGWGAPLEAATAVGIERLHIDPGEAFDPRTSQVTRYYAELFVGSTVTVGFGAIAVSVGGRAYGEPLNITIDRQQAFTLPAIEPRIAVGWQSEAN